MCVDVTLLVVLLACGGVLAYYHFALHRWPWQSSSSSSSSSLAVTQLQASSPPYTPNPSSGLYDPGFVNGQTPGVVTFDVVSDPTGPNGVQYRTTVRWTPPANTTGVNGYRTVWQWGSLSHYGPLMDYLTSDGLNTLVPATRTSYTFTPNPALYAPCPTCTVTGDDACVQVYVISCGSATDVTSCGQVPTTQRVMTGAMACYDPSTIYGYNPCCGCPQANYCLP